MFTVMSPAKTMIEPSREVSQGLTTPALMTEAKVLMDLLRALGVDQIRSLMHVSESLAEVNFERFQSFETPLTAGNARPAMLTYSGDAFKALNAVSLDDEALDWAKNRVAILSGLFGVLRPLDLIQPYRLEMAARLANPAGANLYRYWGGPITERINEVLEANGERVLIDLASAEYSKVIRSDVLNAQRITPVFVEDRDGRERKVHSIAAKRARGLMVRYIIENRIEDTDSLTTFDLEGYGFRPEKSTADTWVFSKK